MLALTLAIKEVRDFFNVKGNMTAPQIAMTAELILDEPSFHDLSLANVKACFRHRMKTERVYDRIDGNLLIGWLREFKSEMAEACYDARLHEERTQDADAGAISHAVYLEMLKARADSGEPEAMAIMGDYAGRRPAETDEERHRKDVEFFKFKTEYQAKKGIS